MGPARIDWTLPWLLGSLFVMMDSSSALGLVQWPSRGSLVRWTVERGVDIAAYNVASRTNRISSGFDQTTENSRRQTTANTEMSGVVFSAQRENDRYLSNSTLPAPNSVEWIASPPGFELSFAIVATTDRVYDSSLASFEDCSIPIVDSGLSVSEPQFLPDQMTLTDTVSIDIDQLAATVYQVSEAQSTTATLKFCHVLTMYTRDPETGAVSSSALHRSSTKVSADINLLRPFTTPSAIQLSPEPDNESVVVDGGLTPDVNAYTCGGDKQEIQLPTLTAGDTLRICVGSSPPPDSITDINLSATPSSGGSTESYPLVSSGRIQRTIPGEITLGDCNNDVCAFDYSPQFSFFLDSPYSLTLTGTITLRIGNGRRQTRELDGNNGNAQFKLTVETAVSDLEGLTDKGMSKAGVASIVILILVAFTMAAVFLYHRNYQREVESQPTNQIPRDESDDYLVDMDCGNSSNLSPSLLEHNEPADDADSMKLFAKSQLSDVEEAFIDRDEDKSTTVKPEILDDKEDLVDGCGHFTEKMSFHPQQLDLDEFSVDVDNVNSENIFAYPEISDNTIEFSDTEV